MKQNQDSCHQHSSDKNTQAAWYVCPMHSEIRQKQPGNCPICGMTLEPEIASKEVSDNPEYLLM